MDIKKLLDSKDIKAKEKTATLAQWLVDKKITAKELIDTAQEQKDSPKATCIEAFEFATREDPSIANEKLLQFVTQTLIEKAPRVKWESAKVVGNIAHLFPSKLGQAVSNLLMNSEDSGTVVRWSAAFALGEILKLGTKINKTLLPAVEAICKREEQNSIKKIYVAAVKKIQTK
ncbi:MAG: HEAT repeat domain-containing protein [Bacteroidota bacterium]